MMWAMIYTDGLCLSYYYSPLACTEHEFNVIGVDFVFACVSFFYELVQELDPFAYAFGSRDSHLSFSKNIHSVDFVFSWNCGALVATDSSSDNRINLGSAKYGGFECKRFAES